MASEFTVIINVRQHFGDEQSTLPGVFAGTNKDFSFECPRVDPSEVAVLVFQTLGVDHERNDIHVNSSGLTGEPEVHGGIPVSRSEDDWNGNIMLIRPNFLREQNTLHIGSRDERGSLLGDVDDFVVDNMVVFYKTKPSRFSISGISDTVRGLRAKRKA